MAPFDFWFSRDDIIVAMSAELNSISKEGFLKAALLKEVNGPKEATSWVIMFSILQEFHFSFHSQRSNSLLIAPGWPLLDKC